MKMWIGFALFFWLLCGLIGDWMLDGRENLHWKAVARGPLILIEAFNADPISFRSS